MIEKLPDLQAGLTISEIERNRDKINEIIDWCNAHDESYRARHNKRKKTKENQ